MGFDDFGCFEVIGGEDLSMDFVFFKSLPIIKTSPMHFSAKSFHDIETL